MRRGMDGKYGKRGMGGLLHGKRGMPTYVPATPAEVPAPDG